MYGRTSRPTQHCDRTPYNLLIMGRENKNVS